MKITPFQQYVILGVFGFLALSFLFYQFALKPINSEITALEAKRDQEKKELEEAKKIVAKYVEFKKRADSIQRELEWIQNRIPKTIEQTKLLEAVSLAQQRSGVFLTNFQFQTGTTASKDATAYMEVPINLTFTSSYKSFVNFLYQVSVSNLFMTVRDLIVTPITDLNRLDVSLQATVVLSGIQAKP